MKIAKRAGASIATLASVICLMLSGCGKEADNNATLSKAADKLSSAVDELGSAISSAVDDIKNGALDIKDAAGREIHFDKPAEKIIAVTAADCEILYAIGAGNTLIGRGTYCDYPSEVSSVPEVKSGSELNVEEITALSPDAVVMGKMDQTIDQVNALEKAGLKVVITDANSISETYNNILMLGTLTGREENALSMVTSMKAGFDEIKKAASKTTDKKKVYFEVSPLQFGLWAAGQGTFMDEAAEICGLVNVFSDVDGWAEVSEEQVIAKNPDVIVTVSMYFGDGPTPEEEILSRAGWNKVSAVENKKILNLSDNSLSRPGPRLLDGAKKLYEFAYGK